MEQTRGPHQSPQLTNTYVLNQSIHYVWQDFRNLVKDVHLTYGTVSNRIPTNFTFCPRENGYRLYFLGLNPSSREHSLQYLDLNKQGQPLDENPARIFKIVTASQFKCTATYSREEQLFRERKRTSYYGITSYEHDEKCQTIILQSSGSLLYFQSSFDIDDATAFCINTKLSATRLYPKVCPYDSNIVSFVSGGDIYVSHLKSGFEHRLTFCSLPDDDSLRSAGIASFISQEEFDRFTAYWWQPIRSDDSTYRILYEEVDISDVEEIYIQNPVDSNGEVETYRYPRAGTTNASSQLKIVEFTVDASNRIHNRADRCLSDDFARLVPWMEYIVRCGWHPNGTAIWIQVLSRDQKHLALILAPLDCFDDKNTAISSMRIIYEEKSDIWINVHDILYFLPQSSLHPSNLQFIWASQKSGFRHLYLITVDISKPNIQSHAIKSSSQIMPCPIIREVHLTEGDWEVLGCNLWVDPSFSHVFFLGLKDSPLETHLYSSRLSDCQIERHTKIGMSHYVYLDQTCSIFVTSSSSLDLPPTVSIHSIANKSLPSSCIVQTVLPRNFNAPEVFSFHADNGTGHLVYGLLYRPNNYVDGERYPTIVNVYGGPQVQLVTNSFKGQRFLRFHAFLSIGYCLVVIDGRGSWNRGLEFESFVKNNLGQIEIADQVEGLQYIAERSKCIDMSRVAIHGWSYGGYLSLMALAQRPDIFKVAIAAGPVTSWREYDTAYTERYLGLPSKNLAAYNASSVLKYVHQLPSEDERLMLVHGALDENVHCRHTSLLINALVEKCKPYRLLLYPQERHGLRQPEASEHFETSLLSFVYNHV